MNNVAFQWHCFVIVFFAGAIFPRNVMEPYDFGNFAERFKHSEKTIAYIRMFMRIFYFKLKVAYSLLKRQSTDVVQRTRENQFFPTLHRHAEFIGNLIGDIGDLFVMVCYHGADKIHR